MVSPVKYLIGTVVAFMFGALAYSKGYELGEKARPAEVYSVDVNGDNLKDTIIASQNGVKRIFLQQTDGKFKSLESVKAEGLADLDSMNEEEKKRFNLNLENTINNSVDWSK